MSQKPDITKWDCTEVDWDEYESHRPPYTKELYDVIFKHHESHGVRYEVALDVGAGGGTVTRILLQKFDCAIFSDPSTEYISRAQKRFSKESDAGRISFLQRRFHEFDPQDNLPTEGVDMITAGTCIHYGDPAKVMAQLAPLLRAEGTVAVFSYGSTPILPRDDPAAPIVRRCKEKMLRWVHENIVPVDKAPESGTGQARFNNIDFDPATWKDVRRITSMPQEHIWPEWIQPSPSRVREGESMEVVHDDFITKEVDYAFFPTYFHNFAPPLPILEQIQEEVEELKEAMRERRVVARWPVILVLATKR